jgi:predicted  nucleic acid-binding Zn-ribbon protein
MSMTDVQKIEMLRTDLQRIQILRMAALQKMQEALGSFEFSQEQADAGVEGMRVAKEDLATARKSLEELQAQEAQVATHLRNLQSLIEATEQIATPVEPVVEAPVEPEPEDPPVEDPPTDPIE